jgi:hypothetical protein
MGNAAFAPGVNYAVGSSPASAAVGDLDGDGKLDIAVVDSASGDVSVLRNTGNGTFAPAVNFTGWNPWSLAMGDLNGDGRPDLAVGNISEDNFSVLLNSCLP